MVGYKCSNICWSLTTLPLLAMDKMKYLLIANIIHTHLQVVWSFSSSECLQAHNNLRSKHVDTPPLRYSRELAQAAQRFVDELARTDSGHGVYPTKKIPRRRRAIPVTPKFFHKELWDGEVLFPTSKWDINRNRQYPIGESIHKFCCYSHPYCPKEFFYQLNFPPSATSVVEQWYQTEIGNYDFQRGIKKRKDEEILHFTNIAWSGTSLVGCAQSRKSPKGCIYTIALYRAQGSIGLADKFRSNVKELKSNVQEKPSSSSTILNIFLIVFFLIILFIICAIAFFKRDYIRHKYSEFMIMRNIRRSERGPGKDDWLTRVFPCLSRQTTVVYQPSARLRKPRPTIEVVSAVSPSPDEGQLDQEDDTTVVYENVPKKSGVRIPFSKKGRYEKSRDELAEQSPSRVPINSHSREPLIPKVRQPDSPDGKVVPSTVDQTTTENGDRVSTYVNVDFGNHETNSGRPQSGHGPEVPRKPLLPTKPQVNPRLGIDNKPTPARRPASDAVLSVAKKGQSPQRHVSSAEEKGRPCPAPRNKPRAESDSRVGQPADLKSEINKLRKTASNEPTPIGRKPQPPRRPDSHNPPRHAYDSDESLPKQIDNRYSDSSGAGRISEMKRMLGNQGVR